MRTYNNTYRKNSNGRWTAMTVIFGGAIGTAIDFLTGMPLVGLSLGLCYGLWMGAAIDSVVKEKIFRTEALA